MKVCFVLLLLICYSYSERKQELEEMTSAAIYLDQAAGYLCYYVLSGLKSFHVEQSSYLFCYYLEYIYQ